LHVGFEFALLAQNFLLLQLDLLLLLDNVDLNFLGLHQLAGLIFLQIVRQVGLGFALVHRSLIEGERSFGSRAAPQRFWCPPRISLPGRLASPAKI